MPVGQAGIEELGAARSQLSVFGFQEVSSRPNLGDILF
jgi:hypothetical protein